MKDILKSKIYLQDITKVIQNIALEKIKSSSILITGGLGLICSAVVDLLVVYNEQKNADIKIYVAARNQDVFEERYGAYPCVTFVPYDATQQIAFDIKADYIIHGAGLASPDLYVTKPVETMLSNINGVKNLLEYAREHNTKRLLYISSSEVYGRKDTADAFEESSFGSVDINAIRSSYSEAKRASEVLCRAYSAEYGVDTVMVRPGHIYGPTASPRDKRISSEFAYLAAQGKPLVMKSPGLQKRSYCYCIDCAVAVLVAMQYGKTGEAYNIGHDEVTSIRQMADILAAVGNVKLSATEPTEADLRQFNPMDNSSLDNSRIKIIGYKDTFSVQEGLSHTVEILKEVSELQNDC